MGFYLSIGFAFLTMGLLGAYLRLMDKAYRSGYAKLSRERRRRIRELLIRYASSKEITNQEGNDIDRLTEMVDKLFKDLPPP